MRIKQIIDKANALVESDQYIDYLEDFQTPLKRAINQSEYDGVGDVSVDNLKDFLVFINTFWMYLPDMPYIRKPVFFEICSFCEICLEECEDYSEYF